MVVDETGKLLIESLKAKTLGSLGLVEHQIKTRKLEEALKDLEISKNILRKEFDKLKEVI